MTGAPIFLYLHGFASSPASSKARAFEAWGKSNGIAIDVLDLRVPSFEGLRFSAIKQRVRDAIDAAGGARSRAVLIGSSLGGITALRVAEEDARVAAVFAMAPAFKLAERWRARLGEEAWAAWHKTGWLEVDDYATNQRSKVEYGFVEEMGRLDHGFPDVRVPVTVVHGANDDVVEPTLSREWSRGKRHVRLREVEDGHELRASIPLLLEEAATFVKPFIG